MKYHFPIEPFISAPGGAAPLSEETALLPLPQGLNVEKQIIAYGPYLQTLMEFIAQDSFLPLRTALSQTLNGPAKMEEVGRVEVISEKHGAIYNVARIRVSMQDGSSCSFALSSASGPARESILEKEFSLLQYLYEKFKLPFLPRPLFQGRAMIEEKGAAPLPLSLFIAEWFEGFHEFHLSVPSPGELPAIKVWDHPGGGYFLSAEQTRLLYRRAAALLTSYFDTESFKQIYPWHHAAGDFIIGFKGEEIQLKLITARGYQSLVQTGEGEEELLFGLVHFLLNLSFRLRLDRLDGVGELALASPECIGNIVEGFLEAWEERALKTPSLPSVSDLIGLLRSFSLEEWLSLAELVIQDAVVEEDELPFVQSHLEDHTTCFHEALQRASDRVTDPR